MSEYTALRDAEREERERADKLAAAARSVVAAYDRLIDDDVLEPLTAAVGELRAVIA